MNNNKVIVTGGSGMVGRSLQLIYPGAIYLDSKMCNLLDLPQVESIFNEYQPIAVIHLAAKVGGIIDNIKKPAEYFDDNVIMNTNILRTSYKYNVNRFIGILSTCIYPDRVENYPMLESDLHKGPPTPTNFSYGYAKRSLAVQIDAYNEQYSTKYQYITPCNLYGEFDKWHENSHFVAALIKKIILADQEGSRTVQLFGTGKPLRQFMLSHDLARVIKTCIDNDIRDSFNVAPEEVISISEIADIALQAIKPRHVKQFVYDQTKPDGQYRKDVSNNKMLKLIPGFKFTSLYTGIKSTYNNLADNNFQSIIKNS